MNENKNTKIYIRADMNEIIATGHIMRCLSIADAARAVRSLAAAGLLPFDGL